MYNRVNIPYTCTSCHYPIKKEINPDFILKKKFDVSFTYDGYLIVSDKFKYFCETQLYRNLVFHTIIKEPNYYYLECDKIIQLDYKRRNVEFGKLCPICDRFDTVIGASPSYIQQGFVIQESSFYKSEYEFGSYWNRFPLIVVSMSVAKELVKQKFKGLYFKDVLT
jgi:hypothetical protein